MSRDYYDRRPGGRRDFDNRFDRRRGRGGYDDRNDRRDRGSHRGSGGPGGYGGRMSHGGHGGHGHGGRMGGGRGGSRGGYDRRDHFNSNNGPNDGHGHNDSHNNRGGMGGGGNNSGMGGNNDPNSMHESVLGGGPGKRMHRIFGTEEDKVNCSFYFKIGACRHGERCSRLHMKPNFSQTLLLAHFYMPPPDATAASEEEKKRKEMIGINAYNNKPMPHGVKTDDFNSNNDDSNMDDSKRREKEKRQRELEGHYEDFYEDVINEMIRYGDVEELVVCENSGDHMYGNTYVKFSSEEQAAQALVNLRGRYYCGRIIQAEYSPVTDFREGRCRQYDEHNCSRGPYCNFLHLRQIPKFARRYLRKTRLKSRYQYGNSERSRRRRHKLRLPGMFGNVNAFTFNESSDDSSFTDESDYERRWRTFPIRGNSQERRDCISQWNEMLDEKRDRKKKKKLAKMIKQEKTTISNQNENVNSNDTNITQNTLLNASLNQLLTSNVANVNPAAVVAAQTAQAAAQVAGTTNVNDDNKIKLKSLINGTKMELDGNKTAAAANLNINLSNDNKDDLKQQIKNEDISMGIGGNSATLNLPANPPPIVGAAGEDKVKIEKQEVNQPFMNPERLRMLQGN